MNPKERTQKILLTLSEERASFGYGRAAQIDLRLGKSEGYLGRVLRGEVGLQVELLFRALEAMDTDPADFFVRAVDPRLRPEQLLQRLIRPCRERGPQALEQFERLLDREEPEIETAADEERGLEELRQRLDRLEEERFSEPEAVLEPAEQMLETVFARALEARTAGAFDLLCRVLGTLGSLYRVQTRFGTSARCLSSGLRASERYGLRAARADLLQRTSYLLGDQGEYRLAAEVACKAIDLHVLVRDLPGIGRALVDRAIMLSRAGELDAAIEAYESSLDYLPEEAWFNRFSAYQGLGQVFLLRGELEEARKWADLAGEIHRTRRGPNWLRLVWLRGDIDLEGGDFDGAGRALREARDGFENRDQSFDLALVSLQLAKALLRAGRFGEVCDIAADMIGLMKAFQDHRVAIAAIQEFARAALAGELSIELLDRARREIEEGCPGRGTLARD